MDKKIFKVNIEITVESAVYYTPKIVAEFYRDVLSSYDGTEWHTQALKIKVNQIKPK